MPSPAASVILGLGLLVALSTLAPGCSPPDKKDKTPPVELGGCGLPGHTWLPRAQVGAVLLHEEDIMSPMTPSAMDSLIGLYTTAFSPVPFGARVFLFRYTTQDKGKPVEATGMVGVPWRAEGLTGHRPMAIWHHGTTGFMGKCAPSYTLGGDLMGAYLMASLGYVVVVPDYIGLDAGANFDEPPVVRHAYLNLEQTAVGSLDALRAGHALLLDEATTEVVPDTQQVVLLGGSQGGHAAMATDLFAPYYAPEFHITATVAMVPPTDLVGLASYAVSGVNPASAAMVAMLVANHYYYEGPEPFEALLSTELPWDAASTLPDAMYSDCDAGRVLRDATQLDQLFNADLLAAVQAGDWAQAEPWNCYLRDNSLATTRVPRIRDTPTLVVLSEEDTLVYTPVIRDDFQRLCNQGYTLEYLECSEAGHSEGAAWSLPEQMEWLAARLTGEPLDPARVCVQRPAVRCSGQPTE